MFTDGRYGWDGGTGYFTTSNWGKAIISEYARTFSKIRVFCRCSLMNMDNIPRDEIIDIPNVSFTCLPPFRGVQGYLWHRNRVLREIREGLRDCDVCFVRIPCQVSSAGIKVARSMGIPVVCQLVGDSQMVLGRDETIIPTRLLRLIASSLAFRRQHTETNLCQAHICISKDLAWKYCDHPETVLIIPNTKLTDDAFIPFRSRAPLEPFNALFVGRLEHHKNVQLFLRALAELRNQGRKIITTIVGDGKYSAALKHLAEQLAIADAVRFTGRINSRVELLDCYRRAHMLYLLSLSEGLGLVLMEAGAASLPILGSRVGGIPELAQEGENAFLVEPGDVQGCVQAIKQLADDEFLRQRMGRRSQKIMRPYTVKRVVSQGAEVIRSVFKN